VERLVEAQEHLAVVTRLYAVLSRVNEAIVRTHDEQRLYEEICRIVADDGDFPLVWVGLVSARKVVPVASSGRAVDYLRDIRVEVDGELGQGPTGTCIREDRPVINYDFRTSPSAGPWREAARSHDLRASASFPLYRWREVIGALTFYAARPGAFTPDQVRLLEALCADISYALGAMEHERLRAEAERALREREQSLREADRRKDEFIGMLSHELRNPLAPIRNSLYLLEHAEATGQEAHRARDVINRQVGHLTRLVDDLLDVTRITRGKVELRRVDLEFAGLLRRTADDYRQMMQDRGLDLAVQIRDEPLVVNGDETRLAQVFGNLLANAAKFTPAGGSVTIAVQAEGGNVVVRVRDTGPGIAPEVLHAIFEPFMQAKQTLARTEGGLGLGLALVRELVSLHGGEVKAMSGSGGAEFIVRIPLVLGRGRTATPFAGPARADISVPRRVLIVEDNKDAAQTLAEVVRMLGHHAEVAEDGPAAVRRAGEYHPDVVLCDVGLPGMDGYEVARELRAARGRDVRLVAISGYAQPEDVTRAAQAGFDEHIAKPCGPEQIERLLS
jgi:signal transduction histidine kinase